MIYIQSKGAEDWKQFLAEPEKQWKDGFSAKSLAMSWQNSNGIPEKIKEVFNKSSINEFKDLEMLIGIPEYKVSLPGGQHASQNDLFVLARTKTSILPIMVEGKVNESFGPLVSDWKDGMSSGKAKRLEYLIKLLDIENENIDNIRYQLLHRTASAIITANKFHCSNAIVLIHSFSQLNKSFSDFSDFVTLYNLKAQIDGIVGPILLNEINIYWAWINDQIITS